MENKWIKAGAGCGKTTYIINNIQVGDCYLTFNRKNRFEAIKKLNNVGKSLVSVYSFNTLGNKLAAAQDKSTIDYLPDNLKNNITSELLLASQIYALMQLADNFTCETLYVDEVQDLSNQHIKAILKMKWKNIVIVGDENQAIYGYNGVKYFEWDKHIDNLKIEYLDKSYRYGPELAEYSNKYRKNKVVGLGQTAINFHSSWKEFVNLKGKKAILFETNDQANKCRKYLKKQGLNVSSQKDIQENSELENVNYWNWNRIKFKTKILDQTQKECETFIQFLNKLTIINDDIIYINTIHKTKGLEFDNVLLQLSSFETKNKLNDCDYLHKYYVAITRAIKELHFNIGEQYEDRIINGNSKISIS